MSPVRIINTVFICFLAAMQLLACRKSQQQQYESFTFTGSVYECHTHQPLENVHVTVTGKSMNNGGLFNSSHEVASGYTDAKGQYSFRPLKYPGITKFEIYFEKNGYINDGISINTDTLSMAGAANYSYSSTMARLTYLKLVLNDRHPYDSADKLYLQLFPAGGCVHYTPQYVGGSIAVEQLTGMIGVAGNIQNGNIIYSVNANDTFPVQYHYQKNGAISAFFTTSYFCPVGDTTVQYIDY